MIDSRISPHRQRIVFTLLLVGLTVQLLATYNWAPLVTAQLQLVTIRRPDPNSNGNQYISFTTPSFNLGSNSNGNTISNTNTNGNPNGNTNSNANTNANMSPSANTNANSGTNSGGYSSSNNGASSVINSASNSNNNGANGNASGSLGGSQVARFTAKPGSVIVHFDRSHEIQRLQYVLQDGRLATLYQRAVANGQANGGRSPNQSPPSSPSTPSSSSSSMPQLQRRGDLVIGGFQPLPPDPLRDQLRIDDDQTIEILDDKMRGVGQLVGDHVTFELPVGPPYSSNTGASVGTNIIQQQQRQQPVQQPPNGESMLSSDRMDVLATIAADAIQSGTLQAGEAKLRKAGVFVDKLKGKLSQKLLELPDIIEAKLRAKSSKGQTFLDQAGNQVMVIEENGGGGSKGNSQTPNGGAGGGGYQMQQTLPILLRTGLDQQEQPSQQQQLKPKQQQQQQQPQRPQRPLNQQQQFQNRNQQRPQQQQPLVRIYQQESMNNNQQPQDSEVTVITPAQLASGQGLALSRQLLTD